MAERKIRPLPEPQGGMFQGLTDRLKLIFRLMADRRVSPLLKLLPLGTLVYLLIPDLAPGPLDDAFLIWLGAYLFVELCPPAVVQEHLERLKKEASGISSGAAGEVPPIQDDDIIEAEFWEEEK
jgi:hypothetical protein